MPLKESVNPSSIIKASSDIASSASSKLKLSILVDQSSHVTLVAAIRDAFAKNDDGVELDVRLFSDTHLELDSMPDLCLILGGDSAAVGPTAALAKAAGIPTIVLCYENAQCVVLSGQNGFVIDEGSVLYCNPVDQDSMAKLFYDLGHWIAKNCPDCSTTIARIYPFLRGQIIDHLTLSTALQNVFISVVPLIPGADMPAITFNQCKLVLKESVIYGEKIDSNRIPGILLVVAGGFVCRGVAHKVCKNSPFLVRCIFKGGLAFGATIGMSRAAQISLQHGWGTACAQKIKTNGQRVVSAVVPQSVQNKLSQKLSGTKEKAEGGLAKSLPLATKIVEGKGLADAKTVLRIAQKVNKLGNGAK